jgi:hypothetical protein
MMEQRTPEQPRLSAHGLVEFMTGNFIGRELVLRRFKYQYPGRRGGFAPYYQPAMTAIRHYHREGNDPGVFNSAISELESRAAAAVTPQARTRAHANIRAINEYQHHFGSRQFEILTRRRFPPMFIAGTLVSCNPDLEVLEYEEHLYLLLNFAVTPPEPEAVAMLCQILHRSAEQVEGEVPPGAIHFLDVNTGQDIRWSGRGKQRWAQIEAAMRQYAGLWELV